MRKKVKIAIRKKLIQYQEEQIKMTKKKKNHGSK